MNRRAGCLFGDFWVIFFPMAWFDSYIKKNASVFLIHHWKKSWNAMFYYPRKFVKVGNLSFASANYLSIKMSPPSKIDYYCYDLTSHSCLWTRIFFGRLYKFTCSFCYRVVTAVSLTACMCLPMYDVISRQIARNLNVVIILNTRYTWAWIVYGFSFDYCRHYRRPRQQLNVNATSKDQRV